MRKIQNISIMLLMALLGVGAQAQERLKRLNTFDLGEIIYGMQAMPNDPQKVFVRTQSQARVVDTQTGKTIASIGAPSISYRESRLRYQLNDTGTYLGEISSHPDNPFTVFNLKELALVKSMVGSEDRVCPKDFCFIPGTTHVALAEDQRSFSLHVLDYGVSGQKFARGASVPLNQVAGATRGFLQAGEKGSPLICVQGTDFGCDYMGAAFDPRTLAMQYSVDLQTPSPGALAKYYPDGPTREPVQGIGSFLGHFCDEAGRYIAFGNAGVKVLNAAIGLELCTKTWEWLPHVQAKIDAPRQRAILYHDHYSYKEEQSYDTHLYMLDFKDLALKTIQRPEPLQLGTYITDICFTNDGEHIIELQRVEEQRFLHALEVATGKRVSSHQFSDPKTAQMMTLSDEGASLFVAGKKTLHTFSLAKLLSSKAGTAEE